VQPISIARSDEVLQFVVSSLSPISSGLLNDTVTLHKTKNVRVDGKDGPVKGIHHYTARALDVEAWQRAKLGFGDIVRHLVEHAQ
jgi:hypothetical protein